MTAPVAATRAGRLRGVAADGVVVYRGVPYAAPPVGPLRWRPPQPHAPWDGERDATAFRPDPMQAPGAATGTRAPGVSEDCLTLNVWAPASPPPGGAPVMVWFFGGSFVYGSATQAQMDGERFARDGVVLITVNYRLGIFGYLAHRLLSAESPDGVSGNYGLRDMAFALRWVRENAAAFGGDPRAVTAFGVSAGAASIAALLTSPLGRGLFDRAILQSPGSFRPLCTLPDAERWGEIAGDDLAAMRGIPAADLLALTPKIGPAVRQLTAPRILRPIHDGVVVPLDEAEAFERGAFDAVPAIVGSNADEGGGMVANLPIRGLTEWRAYLDANFGEHAPEAASLYPAADDAQVRRGLADVFGDTQFSYGARRLAAALAERVPVYRYVYRQPTRGRDPVHSDEVPLVFGNPEPQWTASDRAVSDAIHAAWVRFATAGDPGADGLAWPRYDPADDVALALADGFPAVRGWRAPQLDFLARYYRARATA